MEMGAHQIEDIVRCMKAAADMLEKADHSIDSDRKRQAERLREAVRQILEFSR
jgi:hypothetical protein